jgi:hypothetical protein
VPALICLSDLFVAPVFDVHIRVVYGTTTSLVINNAFHKVECVLLFITFCIHVFSYDVCSIFITATIRELNIVGSCVQHGIGIGLAFHSYIEFTLVPYKLPSADLTPNR